VSKHGTVTHTDQVADTALCQRAQTMHQVTISCCLYLYPP